VTDKKERTVSVPKEAGKVVHFHHDSPTVHVDHKHEVKAGGFDCTECADYVEAMQKLNPDNYVDWEVSK
jgi:hypothetical protein